MPDKNDDLNNLLINDSFVRWIEGKASSAEQKEWEEWLGSNNDHQNLYDEFKYIHTSLSFKRSDRQELESELVRLNKRINRNQAGSRGSDLRLIKRKTLNFMPRIAAAILLIITSLVIFRMVGIFNADENLAETIAEELTVTVTENGQKKILTLTDGSRITLNANSELKYSTKTRNGNIEVWLKGEAYFDIVHKPEPQSREFIVYANRSKVSVLGTKFNVNSYQNGTQIYLQEGKVGLEIRDSLDQVMQSYVMNPGELSMVSETDNLIHTSQANSDIHTSWIDNKLVFEDATLEEIAVRLGHIYKVNFELHNASFKDFKISGSLPNNNLTVFVNALENLTGKSMIIRDSTVIVRQSLPDKQKTN